MFGSCDKEEESLELHSNPGSSFLDVENDGYFVTLNAQAAPEGQTGSWKIFMGENGSFDDETNPQSNFFGEPGETYLLGWEVSHGNQYEVANINVSFKALEPRILTVIEDTLHNNISLQLEAEAPKFGAEGRWEIIDGQGGRIENFQYPDAQFMGIEDESYILRWTLFYGSKEESLDFTFQTDVLRAEAGDDRLDIKTSKEETKYCELGAFLPAGASGNWEIIEGGNGTVLSPDNPHSLFEGVADSLYTLSWTVKLDAFEVVDTVKVRFRGKWGMWKDIRDGQSYRFAEVNGLEWMADNYNYAVEPGYGSWYYGHGERSIIMEGHALENEEERKYYGRLYDWHTAYNYAPEGWRLPSYEEFSAMLAALGGPLYADKRIKEGGDTGLELSYAGYYNLDDPSDPAFRNVFKGQDISGVYWLDQYIESNGYAAIFEVTAITDKPGTGGLPTKYFKLPVRYVRDVQN
jgi:uncharacterized protein (TIGR02145 family)